MIAAQCDDPTPPTASMSVEVQSDCSGTAEVLLSFTINSDDDDDETYEIQYQIAGITYTLANAVSGQVVSHTVSASTNAILQRLTAFEDDDDDDICVVNLNQVVFIDVNLPPFLTITSISEPTCGFTNGSITVNATDGTPPYQYRLNGQSFQSNTTFTDLGPGNYTITVRDANGCEDLVQESLSDAQAPTVVVTNSQLPDSGQNNGSISVMASGGTPPYQYSLNGQSFQSNTTFTGLGAGSYTITVRDANGCEDLVTEVLNETSVECLDDTPPSAFMTVLVDANCTGSAEVTISFFIDSDDDDEIYEINYQIAGTNYTLINASNGQTASHTINAATNVVLLSLTSVADDDDNDVCVIIINQSLPAEVNALLALTITNSQLPDSGQNNGSISVMASGGTPPYQYSINGQSFQSNTTFTGLGAGSYTITVRDANGCEDTVTGNLSTGMGVLSLQVLDIENPDCGETSGVIMVNATGGTPPYLYLINGQGAQNSPTFTNLPAGSYTITVQDANGLQSSIVGMLEDSVPGVVAENDGPVTVASTLSEALLISVLDNDEWEGNSVEVTLLQNPLLGSATVEADNQIAYLPFPNLVGTDSLVYMVCDSQCLGACDTAVVYLLREPQVENDCDLDYIPPDVVFPQGLTPNNDGWNDVLIFEIVDEIGCPSNYANSDITIFNRWGQRVFVQEPYLNNWAGQTLDGKDLPAGVYYYTLRIKRQNREDYLYFGDVSIFR